MKINTKIELSQARMEYRLSQGLAKEEATRLAQIVEESGQRRYDEVSSTLIDHRETLRLVDPLGLDELVRTNTRQDQWAIVRYYVFQDVIRELSRSDTKALAEYALWVFHQKQFHVRVDRPSPDPSFGSLGNVFGDLDIKLPP